MNIQNINSSKLNSNKHSSFNGNKPLINTNQNIDFENHNFLVNKNASDTLIKSENNYQYLPNYSYNYSLNNNNPNKIAYKPNSTNSHLNKSKKHTCKYKFSKYLNEYLPLFVAWILLIGTAIAYMYGPGQGLWNNEHVFPFKSAKPHVNDMHTTDESKVIYHWKNGNIAKVSEPKLNNFNQKIKTQHLNYKNLTLTELLITKLSDKYFWTFEVFRPYRIILYLHGLLFFYLLCNFVACILIDPGIYPVAGIEEEIYRNGGSLDVNDDLRAPLYTRIEIKGVTVQLKWCNTCKFYRPPRCSHCSVCDACIDRFDHHCPWLHNCVGRGNYKYFFIFLALLTIHTITVFAFCSIYTFKHLKYPRGDVTWIITAVLAALALVLFLPIIGLCGFHALLIFKGRTTNEHVTGKFKSVDNPYNEGWLHNCLDILGKDNNMLHLRCIPISFYLKRWDGYFIHSQKNKNRFTRFSKRRSKKQQLNAKQTTINSPSSATRYVPIKTNRSTHNTYVKYHNNPDRRQSSIMRKIGAYLNIPSSSSKSITNTTALKTTKRSSNNKNLIIVENVPLVDVQPERHNTTYHYRNDEGNVIINTSSIPPCDQYLDYQDLDYDTSHMNYLPAAESSLSSIYNRPHQHHTAAMIKANEKDLDLKYIQV